MNKINFYLFLLSASLIFSLSSCGGDDNDNSPPEITVNSSTPEPVSAEICGILENDVFKLYSSDTLTMRLSIEDNEALSQLKLDIHNNFDCHGHGGGQAPGFDPPDVANQTEDWTILDIIDLSGSSQELNLDFPVPANVTAGTYHLGIQAVDAAGNESAFSNIYDLKVWNLSDTIAPEITLDGPTEGELDLSRGETVTFKGQVTDNRSLEEGGNAVVFLTYEKISSGNHFTGPFSVIQSGGGKEEAFNIEFAFPQSATVGAYKLYVNAHDAVRNKAESVVYDVNISD